MDGAYGSDHRLLFIDIVFFKRFHGTTTDPVSVRTATQLHDQEQKAYRLVPRRNQARMDTTKIVTKNQDSN